MPPPSDTGRLRADTGRLRADTGRLRGELRLLGRLSTPIATAQLGMMAMGVVDSMMVARIGLPELAAVAVASTLAWSTGSLAQGIVQGMDPLVSQAHGAGDGDAVALALQRGLIVALVVSIPLAALWLMTEPLLLAAGQDAEVSRLAQQYMWARLPSALGFNLFVALRQYLAGRGITRPSMWVMLGCNAVNAFLNWVLIFGELGMPRLGLVGSGLGTGIANVILPLSLWAWIARFRLHADAWRPWDARSLAGRGLRRHVALGLPVGLGMALEANAFTIAMVMVGWLGVLELGAHQIVMNMASFTFMAPLGVSIAASARAGNLIGSGDTAGLRVACRAGFLLGGGVMALAAVCMIVFQQGLPRLYTSEASLVAMAATLLPIAGAFQISDGVQVVGAGLMRGMGRPQAGATVNLLGFYVLGLPCAWLLAFPLGLGLPGIWWGLAAGIGCVAVLLVAWVSRTHRRPLDSLRVRSD